MTTNYMRQFPKTSILFEKISVEQIIMFIVFKNYFK